MSSLSLFYAIPAALFVFVAALFYINRSIPRGIAVLPVLATYLIGAFILVCGGCREVAHVQLNGMEADLVDAEGNPRAISLGGSGAEDLPAGIEVPGYPVDALRVSMDGKGLVLSPGTGYERGLLVRSAGDLIPLEPGGLPRLQPLRSGDVLRIAPDAGGEVLAQWHLGLTKYDLQPGQGATFRWVGGKGSGLAKLAETDGDLFGLRADGPWLILKKGDKLPATMGLMLNGRRLKFAENGEQRVAWQPGITTLALVGPDPAAGVATLHETTARYSAWLDWDGINKTKPEAYPLDLDVGRVYRVGGTLEDDLVVKGLPSGVLQLNVDAQGQMRLELTDAGRKAQKDGLLHGTYPATATGQNQGVLVGLPNEPEGGKFVLLDRTTSSAVAEEPSIPDSTEAGVVNGDDAASPAPASRERWHGAWVPNASSRLVLTNRQIIVPLMNAAIALGSRRPWTQNVFSLADVTAKESGLRSALVYGQPHDFWFNGVNLLQLEQGITVERGGVAMAFVARKPGLLGKGGKVEFLQIMSEVQAVSHGVAFGTGLHPAQIVDQQRVALRKRFGDFSLQNRLKSSGKAKQTIPYLHVAFEKPVVRSILLKDVEQDLKSRTPDESISVKFGLNDRTGFSTLPHQVNFADLSRWFRAANADVELNWLSFVVKDDFGKQQHEYGKPFKIGGDRRLLLTITKHNCPWTVVGLMVLMGVVASVACLALGANLSWSGLFFAVGMLTCSRVLFGEAAAVNPPFNPDILGLALKTLVGMPLLLGLGAWGMRHVLPGRFEIRLLAVESWVTYNKLMLLAVAGLVVRVILLAMGFKEAVPLGTVRLALSIGFVPFYLLLFALSFYVLWREKLKAGWLSWELLRPFIICTFVLSICQGGAAIAVSDLGMMLYFIPQSLLLAAFGVASGVEGGLRWLREPGGERREKTSQTVLGAVLPVLPLILIAIVFLKPQWMLGMVPGLRDKMTTDEEMVVSTESSDLVTDSTMLRVLQFTNRDYLINLGTDTAERIAQDHAIMENYAHRGLLGEGYLKVDVLPAKAVTSMNDNVSAIFIFAQFGVLGAIAVAVAYLAVGLAAAGAQGPAHGFTSWLALVSGLSFCLVSLYMMLANYGILPFTGRNMYLLGLNSASDVAESCALLIFIVLGLTRARFHEEAESVEQAAEFDLDSLK